MRSPSRSAPPRRTCCKSRPATSTRPFIGSKRRAGSSPAGRRPTRASARSTTPSREPENVSWSPSSPSGSNSHSPWPASSGSRSSAVPLHQLSSRLRALVRRRRVESELDDEIRFHLEAEADEQRATGLSEADAGRAARRDFGNVILIRETMREAFGWGAADRLIRDVRDGYRTLKSAPIVSIVAILSLGLGIGANTAIFSVLDGLLLKPLPVAEPDRLILLGDESGQRRHWTSPIWREIDRRRELFDGAFAVSSTRFNLAVRGESEYVDGMWATGRMFEVLGVQARLGRTFTERDDQPGGGPDGAVAVISDRFWQQRFGRSTDVIGRHLTVDRVPFTIVGVTPPKFFGVEVGRTFDVAIPVGTVTLMRGANALERRSSWWLRIMMRLQPAQSLDTATATLRALQPQIRAATL